MLNKLQAFIRQFNMIAAGDTVICAVSGGADSMALLFAMYLMQPRLDYHLEAAHFNHQLRGEESDRDEAFVRQFCEDYKIPFHSGTAKVEAGEKGLEAAAREARYSFLLSLNGKIATAHTANDNAETVLMHMVRGTGLKGLGGIAPVNGLLIRPMLSVTREEVLAFLAEYHVSYVTDSSNHTDRFLRNRLRHQVMPLLEKENPQFVENASVMALRLRQDEAVLAQLASTADVDSVEVLRRLLPAVRSRALASYLEHNGVKEPESEHVALLESLVFSDKPSARASFPNGITVSRNYDRLTVQIEREPLPEMKLPIPGSVCVSGVRIIASVTESQSMKTDCFTVAVSGSLVVRPRAVGDTMRLSGGTKSLKKLFIDRKIPEHLRMQIPVIADDLGVVGVYGIGANLDRLAQNCPCVEIKFEEI